MLKKSFILLSLYILALMSCEDSETEFPEQEVTLFDKTWIASDGTQSLRYRLNSDGSYNGGNDEGFPNQGTWNWVSDTEEVMRISYDDTLIWYKFKDLRLNTVKTSINLSSIYI